MKKTDLSKDKVLKSFKKFSFSERENIWEAFIFAKECHKGQKRKSGDEYIVHPLKVASKLAELNMGVETIMAGLLHDTIEDTNCSKKEIEQKFGSEVAKLVEGVTKLGELKFDQLEEKEAREEEERSKMIKNLQKLFVAMAEDIRVVIIKISDRLHNMQTLEYLPEPDQKRIAGETMEIFTPLADRLGMGAVKAELDDLAFRFLLPEEYKKIIETTKHIFKEKEKFLEKMEAFLEERLKDQGVKAILESRAKHYYSLYKKMQKNDLSQITDLMAIRIIVDSIADCYKTLGIIHEYFKPLIYRIKDYIAVQKPNGYRSLHTTVFGMEGRITEIQIRTKEMHEEAEKGVAAHWNYNDFKGTENYKNRYSSSIASAKDQSWVKELLSWQEGAKSEEEFIEGLKIDIFKDRIFVLSPKGDVYDLPDGATPVDFAYAVHSGIGDMIVGAKVNGKIFPIDGRLENRDIVEIITSKTNHPKRGWLEFVVTSRAKQRIRSWLRKQNREENIEIGKDELREELEIFGLKIDKLPNLKLKEILETLPYKTLEDIFSAIGEGVLSAKKIAGFFAPQEPIEVKKKISLTKNKSLRKDEIVAMGTSGVLFSLSSCCNPQKGDPIIGFVTRGKGIKIHKKNCQSIKNTQDRLIEVNWKSPTTIIKKNYQICFNDRVGILGDITGCISSLGLNILNIKFIQNKKGTVRVNVSLSGDSKGQYLSLERRLPLIKDIIEHKTA